MITVKMFLLSILLHFVADYTLQGCLSNLKQRKWWVDYFNNQIFSLRVVHSRKYRHDYICGLVCHALYWTLVTFAPLLWIAKGVTALALIVLGNTLFHAVVDHMKCNCYKINLWQDQVLHLAQIVVTYVIFFK